MHRYTIILFIQIISEQWVRSEKATVRERGRLPYGDYVLLQDTSDDQIV